MQGVRPGGGAIRCADPLLLPALQVPPPGLHMVRYYGLYSVRNRVVPIRLVFEVGPCAARSAGAE